MYKDIAIIIPARLKSSRLEEKSLQLIGNKTMIEHTYNAAKKLGFYHLYVATDSEKIFEIIEKTGGKAIMTDSALPSGTDRIYEAFSKIEKNESIKYVINLQGDLPLIDETIILNVIEKLKNSGADIVTPVAKVNYEIAKEPSNVKAVIGINDRALYFSRSIVPYEAQEYFYHIGIYGYKIEALEKFIKLQTSPLEEIEKLEQLRALENGMTIDVCYSNSIPISVDTPLDLEKVRKLYNSMI